MLTPWRDRTPAAIRMSGLVSRSRSRGRQRNAAGPVLGDPRVDPLPPGIEPLDLDLVVGRTRYGFTRHPPPACPDDLIDRELSPHVADRDDVVEPGVRHEDHVGVRAGRDGRRAPRRGVAGAGWAYPWPVRPDRGGPGARAA